MCNLTPCIKNVSGTLNMTMLQHLTRDGDMNLRKGEHEPGCQCPQKAYPGFRCSWAGAPSSGSWRQTRICSARFNHLIPNINISILPTVLTYVICYMLGEFISTYSQIISGDHFLHSNALYYWQTSEMVRRSYIVITVHSSVSQSVFCEDLAGGSPNPCCY